MQGLETLDDLEKGNIIPEKQDESLSSYAPMLSKEMCRLDFSQPVRKVHKKICGLSDWPCAVTMLDGKRLKVYKSEIVSNVSPESTPGKIVNEKDFSVACSDGIVRFTEIQAEGSKRMKTSDYLRGKPVYKGTVLG